MGDSLLYTETIDSGDHIIRTTVYPKPRNACYGINSNAENNKHILLIDYDECKKETVYNDIEHLKKMGLGPFFIYLSGEDSWHVRCPVKMTYYDLTRILMETHCDPGVVDEMLGYKRRNTHRVSNRGPRGAPVLIDYIPVMQTSELSGCHWAFFKEDASYAIEHNSIDKGVMERIEQDELVLRFDTTTIAQAPIVLYQTAKGVKWDE